MSAVPDGFEIITVEGPELFIGVNGPLYRKLEAERLVLGCKVERRHCNPLLICHGGMLSTFVDMAMAYAIHAQARLPNFVPTINLTTDFLGPAPLGAWIEARTDVLKQTRNLVFAQCLVTSEGKTVTRASGVFKIGLPLAAVFEKSAK